MYYSIITSPKTILDIQKKKVTIQCDSWRVSLQNDCDDHSFKAYNYLQNYSPTSYHCNWYEGKWAQ